LELCYLDGDFSYNGWCSEGFNNSVWQSFAACNDVLGSEQNALGVLDKDIVTSTVI